MQIALRFPTVYFSFNGQCLIEVEIFSSATNRSVPNIPIYMYCPKEVGLKLEPRCQNETWHHLWLKQFKLNWSGDAPTKLKLV